MRRAAALVAALAAAMLISGCTAFLPGGDDGGNRTETTLTQNDGLTVEFGAVAGRYLEDETIEVEMRLENTGQARATGISVSMYGSAAVRSDDLIQRPDSSLRPVDPGSGEPGGSTTAIWRSANRLDLPEGETQDVQVTGEVTYRYNTTARASYSVVPRSDFDGGAEPVATENTAGPVSASVDLKTPVPIFETAEDNMVSVPVTVRNVGDGEVDGPVSFDMDLPGVGEYVLLESCQGTPASDLPIDVALFEDGSREVVCQVNMTRLADRLQFQSTVRMDIGLDYGYVEEEQTSFTVEGLPGDRRPEG